jgi:hypothetical protein
MSTSVILRGILATTLAQYVITMSFSLSLAYKRKKRLNLALNLAPLAPGYIKAFDIDPLVLIIW